MGEISRHIHLAMVSHGFNRDRSHTAGLRFTGSIVAAERKISVAIIFQGESLTTLPRLSLTAREGELPDAIAHIEAEDRVCYARETDLLLDPFDPGGSVSQCLGAMRKALDRIVRLDLTDEIAEEFPQHWLGERSVYSAVVWRRSTEALLFQFPRSRHRAILVLAPNADYLTSFGLRGTELATAKREARPTAVLKTDATLAFRNPHRQPSNFDQLYAWAEFVDRGLGEKIVDVLSVQDKNHLSVFISAPNGIVGATVTLPPLLKKAIQRPAFLHTLLKKRGGELSIGRLSGIRADTEFLFSRNLAEQPNLAGKKIAIAGVGTIGGSLARLIAQSGAGLDGGRLVLFDPDLLAPGNIGRHILPLSYVGLPKAEGCRDFIRSLYPGNDISSVNKDAIDYLEELESFDLVIDATGDEAVATNINRQLFKARGQDKNSPAWMHVSLFGNGVAAQCLLVDSPEFACYQCQKLQDHSFRYKVLHPEHPVVLTPASCNEGSYFAYGVGAPTIAAGLGVQMALDWAAGRPSPRLRTIRIVQKATTAVKDQNPTKRQGCQVCGGQ